MQRPQNVIASLPKAADPVLRRTWSGVAHQRCAFSGSSGERAERLERNVGYVLLDLQRDHSWPGNSDIQAIVRLTTRGFRRIVSRTRPKPAVPIFGRTYFGCGRFSPTNEP